MDYRVTPDEAYFLMNQTFRFYMDPTLYNQFIRTLNHMPEDFNYEEFKS